MSKVMVTYTVKPDRVAENEALVRAVYEELHERRPEGLRYATFRCGDGGGFVHVATVEGEANPLPGMPAFQRFQEGIDERCEEPPRVTPLHEIGSYWA